MGDIEKKTNKEKDKNISFDKLKKKGKTQDIESIKKMVGIRSRIERDYEEDVLEVSFDTSPQTKRIVRAKRPSLIEMISIMEMSAIAAKYEGSSKPDALSKMVEIYKKLSVTATNLSLNKELNEDFWSSKVSFTTLQSFITSLIMEAQKGQGVGDKDMKTFR